VYRRHEQAEIGSRPLQGGETLRNDGGDRTGSSRRALLRAAGLGTVGFAGAGGMAALVQIA
jgi:hypothetical protein